ncbi:MAG: hypothetical protein GY851_06720, partial [bacterium]|nr:hypothetical protein [bacterium]
MRNATGRLLRQSSDVNRARWRTSWLEWKVPVPADAKGKIWRFRQSPPLSAILRIDGIAPLVHPTSDAVFTPAAISPAATVVPRSSPPGWRHKVVHIETGKKMIVPRGKKTGEGTYEHVHAHRGTIEFWMRADTSDAGMDNLGFLDFGKMR